MYYYIRLRGKGTLNWKAFRENGKIVVFENNENAKGYASSLKDKVCKIISIQGHPSNRISMLHGKKYRIVEG